MNKIYSYTKDFETFYEITNVQAFLNLSPENEKREIYEKSHAMMKMQEMIENFSKNNIIERDESSEKLIQEVVNTFELLDDWFSKTLSKDEYEQLKSECQVNYKKYVMDSVKNALNDN